MTVNAKVKHVLPHVWHRSVLTVPHCQPGTAIPADAPKQAPRSQRRAWPAPGPVSEQPWVPTPPHPWPCHPISGPPLQRGTQTAEACGLAQTGAAPGSSGCTCWGRELAGTSWGRLSGADWGEGCTETDTGWDRGLAATL
ncbi:hypothetical protein E2C01_034478 [Portunus trituberculatus]|uniref:Uncharacterized protein n=1 Tax=Portunus trituberculatus TaxID=210409 RepID=A0A5B7F5S9_PORTR|nr:hypothetical protein [Portunus trituberculatus]